MSQRHGKGMALVVEMRDSFSKQKLLKPVFQMY
jgi:hypothetical protein